MSHLTLHSWAKSWPAWMRLIFAAFEDPDLHYSYAAMPRMVADIGKMPVSPDAKAARRWVNKEDPAPDTIDFQQRLSARTTRKVGHARDLLPRMCHFKCPLPPVEWYAIQGDYPLHMWEVANLRLPHELADDVGIVALQAWAQGIDWRKLKGFLTLFDAWEDDLIPEALVRLTSHPLIGRLLAMQRIPDFVSGFPDLPMTEVMAKVIEWRKDPWSMTVRDATVLEASPVYQMCIIDTVNSRRGGLVLPEGVWYFYPRYVVSGPTEGGMDWRTDFDAERAWPRE